VITNTTYTFGQMLVSGYLQSTPDSDFQIELYQNEPYGNFLFGEGQTFLGAIGVSTDGSGLSTFQFSIAAGFTNELFAATATDLGTGDTSEFSSAIPIQHGVLRIIDIRRAGAEIQVSFSTEPGVHYALESSSALPAVSWDLVPGATDVTGTGNVVTVSDTGAGAAAQRFYRIQQIP